LKLGPAPNKNWAALTKDRPYSLSTGYNHLPLHPILQTLVPTSQDQPQTWRYSTDDPGNDNWYQTGFNDQGWKEAPGPFGSRGRNAAAGGTAWHTKQIWLRRSFTLQEMQGQIALLIAHQESIDVYINGVLAVTSPGSSRTYTVYPLSAEGLAALHPGTNVMAVHAYVDFGGPFADVGVVDVQWPDSEKGAQ
jgi:hypothetical protein